MTVFALDDPSRLAVVRRAASDIASGEGLDEVLAAKAAVVTSEIATNILKHAGSGELFISGLSDRVAPGIEILGIDRGPGIADVSRCLGDGYSTSGTSGTGLGAIARLSTAFDIYSQPGSGTVVVARVLQPAGAGSAHFAGPETGAILKPISGEEVAGDCWAITSRGEVTNIIVADGLGHGLLAARASSEAISTFRRSSESAPVEVLRQVHGALRGTRGAAVSMASIDFAASAVRYAGIGNITGLIAGPEKTQYMVSHSGTAGHDSLRLQEFRYGLPAGALIIMHSDGLTTSWHLNSYPGLYRRHASVIAGVLYRDAARLRDDVCVVVARAPEAK